MTPQSNIQQSNSQPPSFTTFMRGPWGLAAAALLAFLFATNVYRAATQSIAHDEGLIFEWFLAAPWSSLFGFEHGNHHPLNDLLCKLSIGVLGPSELSYRLPALLGSLLLFYSIFRICVFVFGGGPFFFLAVGLIALNPLLLDYLCYGRGYSLALGLFFCALDCLIRYLAASGPGRRQIRLLLLAGVALGLSVGTNPIMIFPGGALAGALFVLLVADSLHRKPQAILEPEVKAKKAKRARQRKPRYEAVPVRGFGQALLWFGLPLAVVGGFLLSLPNRLVELEPGYLGPPSLAAILESLLRNSLYHSPLNFPGFAVWLPPDTWVRIAGLLAVLCLLGLCVAASAVVYRWFERRAFDELTALDRFLVLVGMVLPLALLLIVVSRYEFDQPYPEMRTAVYWLPLLSLAALAVVRQLWDRAGEWRAAAGALAAVLTLCMIQFATQFNTRYFAEWAYCAAGKDMIRTVVADHARNPAAHVTIGATWKLEPVINFYRVAWQLPWIEPVTRAGPAGRYDYYMLLPEDGGIAERLGLKRLSEDRLSGAVLAKPPQ